MEDIDIQILDQPIDTKAVEAFVQDDTCGGIVSFVGTVRNQTQKKRVVHLEFESYDAMALKEMRKIAQTILDRWPAKKVSFHHRKGRLMIGEVAVAISVSCPHRAQAFEACEYAIDTLKETVPIWKKEVFEDGEVWVAAHP
ncbi:MAG: molybdenum cofactor biosynthesis protein MoaE [Saprospiraceae bacterium]|nr:molybdenum cofactor biosynthesis protein MoaE [Saprospiraceae bacterium]